jgi:hypothetical protein
MVVLCYSRQVSGIDGLTTCSDCAAGFVAPSPGLTLCSVCPQGKFSGTARGTFCFSCLVRHFTFPVCCSIGAPRPD